MSVEMKNNPTVTQAEIVGAALRYSAVADWFEAYPCTWQRHMSLDDAMDVFNRAEQELRTTCAAALRQRGHRALLLAGFGVPEEAR